MLVKRVIQAGGSITPLIIPSELTGGTGLTTQWDTSGCAVLVSSVHEPVNRAPGWGYVYCLTHTLLLPVAGWCPVTKGLSHALVQFELERE